MDGVGAAGVQDDDVLLRAPALQFVEDLRYGEAGEFGGGDGGARSEIHRHQEVFAFDLYAVAGVEEEGGIVRADLIQELAHHAVHILLAGVLHQHGLEARRFQSLVHQACVVDGVAQRTHVVSVVTDDQRNAFSGLGVERGGQQPKEQQAAGFRKNESHHFTTVEGEPARKAIFRLRLSRVVSLVVSAETRRLPAYV